MHQNRASPFASDFYRRQGYRREFRSEDHFYPFSSQKKSRFASNFLRRGNRASWGLKKSRDFWESGKNRRCSRRESRDFGALSCGGRKTLRRCWKTLRQDLCNTLFCWGGERKGHRKSPRIVRCQNPWASFLAFSGPNILPAPLQKLVGDFFQIFWREISWEIWRKYSGAFFQGK